MIYCNQKLEITQPHLQLSYPDSTRPQHTSQQQGLNSVASISWLGGSFCFIKDKESHAQHAIYLSAPIWGIMNERLLGLGEYIFPSLRSYSAVEFLGHTMSLYLTFWATANLFFQCVYAILHSCNQYILVAPYYGVGSSTSLLCWAPHPSACMLASL